MEKFNPAEQRASLRDNVPPDLQDAYDRIVAAGMKFMFSEETHGEVIKFLQGPQQMDVKLSSGVLFIISQIVQQAGDAMPQELIIPAGIDLLLQAAEFSEQTGQGEITVEDIASAIQQFVFAIAKGAGISSEQLMGGVDKLTAMAAEGEAPAEGGMINQGDENGAA